VVSPVLATNPVQVARFGPKQILIGFVVAILGYQVFASLRKTSQETRTLLQDSLGRAARLGSADEVEKLLNAGADARLGAPILQVFRYGGCNQDTLKKADLFLARHADINDRAFTNSYTPLIAASAGCAGVEPIEKLIAGGATLDAIGQRDIDIPLERTALMAAATESHEAIAQVLIDAGANLELRVGCKIN
jgi:ankyrin repeat protein